MNCDEARELITALIDNELSGPERSLIEGHLKECSRCLRVYELERALKKEIHSVGASMSAPAELKRKIIANHGLLPNDSQSSDGWIRIVLPFRPLLRPAFGLALLGILLLPVIYLLKPQHTRPISVAALEIQQKIMDGELSLRTAKNRNELRDWQIQAVNDEFMPMEYDLSSIRLQPAGGLVQDIDGRKMLVTVYSGNGPSITCFTFLGTEQDAPEDATVFLDQKRNIKFYTFSRNEYNAVLHREGNVLCLLVSDMPAEKLLALATGKAGQA